jgi:hypothetical protein
LLSRTSARGTKNESTRRAGALEFALQVQMPETEPDSEFVSEFCLRRWGSSGKSIPRSSVCFSQPIQRFRLSNMKDPEFCNPGLKFTNAFGVLHDFYVLHNIFPNRSIGNRSDRFVVSRSDQRSPTFSYAFGHVEDSETCGARSPRSTSSQVQSLLRICAFVFENTACFN